MQTKNKTNENKSKHIQIDICGLGKKATINAPELRTVNRKAEAGSKSGIIIVIIIVIMNSIISIIIDIDIDVDHHCHHHQYHIYHH